MKQFVKFKFTFCLNLPFPPALSQPFFQVTYECVSPTHRNLVLVGWMQTTAIANDQATG